MVNINNYYNLLIFNLWVILFGDPVAIAILSRDSSLIGQNVIFFFYNIVSRYQNLTAKFYLS